MERKLEFDEFSHVPAMINVSEKGNFKWMSIMLSLYTDAPQKLVYHQKLVHVVATQALLHFQIFSSARANWSSLTSNNNKDKPKQLLHS